MPSDPKLDLLGSIPLFSGLDRNEIRRVGQLAEEIDVPVGRVLMRQGDRGSEMFVVVSGKLGVVRDDKVLAERGPGDVIGEIALLAEMPRTATVTALEPTRLFLLANREFRSLMDEMPTVRTAVLQVLASRISALDPHAS